MNKKAALKKIRIKDLKPLLVLRLFLLSIIKKQREILYPEASSYSLKYLRSNFFSFLLKRLISKSAKNPVKRTCNPVNTKSIPKNKIGLFPIPCPPSLIIARYKRITEPTKNKNPPITPKKCNGLSP